MATKKTLSFHEGTGRFSIPLLIEIKNILFVKIKYFSSYSKLQSIIKVQKYICQEIANTLKQQSNTTYKISGKKKFDCCWKAGHSYRAMFRSIPQNHF